MQLLVRIKYKLSTNMGLPLGIGENGRKYFSKTVVKFPCENW